MADGTVSVTVNGRPLPMRLDLARHSPTGFEWGYAGSGPAQLALAILAWHCGSDEGRAIDLYQAFKFRVVASLPRQSWKLTRSEIESVLEQVEREIDCVRLH